RRGGVPARPRRSRRAAGALPGAAAPAAASRRGAPLRRHLPPAAARRGLARVDVRPAPGRRPRAATGAAQALRLGRARPGSDRGGAGGRPGRAGEDRAPHLPAAAPGGTRVRRIALLLAVAALAGCGGGGKQAARTISL